MLLWMAALASWYSAVVAFLFAGAIGLLGARSPWRLHLVARLVALVVGLVLVTPTAHFVRQAATGPDNLVRIKHPRELMTVRRTTGAADPVGFLRGGDYRSPDFRVLSRYGERFIHL